MECEIVFRDPLVAKIFSWRPSMHIIKIPKSFVREENIRCILRSKIPDEVKRKFVHRCIDGYFDMEVLDEINPKNIEWVFEWIGKFGEMDDRPRIYCAQMFMDNLDYIGDETIKSVLDDNLIQPWMYKKLDEYNLIEDDLYEATKELFGKYYSNKPLPDNFAKLSKYFENHRGESREHYEAVKEFCNVVKKIFREFVIGYKN